MHRKSHNCIQLLIIFCANSALGDRMHTYDGINLEQAEILLDYIPSSIEYESWAKVGRTLYCNFGDAAEDTFLKWSLTSGKESEILSQWKSFRKTRNDFKVGVLFKLAKQHGWQPSKSFYDVNAKYSPEELQRKERERKDHAALRAVQKRNDEKLDAEQLKQKEKLFLSFPDLTEATPFLKKKGIPFAHHLYTLKRGKDKHGNFTAWAIYDVNSEFMGFERIYDVRKTWMRTNKMLCEYSKPARGFAIIGDLASAKRAFVVGGFSDGISLHFATSECAISVVGEGNIPTIIKLLSEKYPHVEFISAPDHDAAGMNAAKSCEQLGFRYTLPISEKSDWNDVLLREGADSLKWQLFKRLVGLKKSVFEQRYLSVEISKGLNLLKSEKETGKTSLINKWIMEHPDKKILIVSYRVMLNASLAKSFKADFYQDLAQIGHQALKDSHRLVITPDSLWKLNGAEWDVIIVDEAEQTLMQFVAKTMSHKAINIDVFNHILQNTETQIFADADLSSLTTSYLSEVVGIKSGNFHHNTYQPRKGSKMFIYRSQPQLTRQSFLWSKEGEHHGLVSNKKKVVERQRRKLLQLGWSEDDILCLHKDTAKDPEVIRKVANLSEVAPDLKGILLSPSGGTGLNCDTHKFSKTVGIFGTKTGTAEQAHQQLARFRQVDEYHVHLDQANSSLPTDPEEIKRLLLDEPDSETLDILEAKDGEWAVSHPALEWLFKHVQAFINLNQNSFDKRFIDRAIAEGYTVIDVAQDELQEEIGKNHDKGIQDIMDEEFRELASNAKILPKHTYDAAKHGDMNESREDMSKSEVFYEFSLKDAFVLQEKRPFTLRTPKKTVTASEIETFEFFCNFLNEATYSRLKDGSMSRKLKKLTLASMPVETAKEMDRRNRKFALSRIDLKHHSKKRYHYQKLLALAGIDNDLNYDGTVWNDRVAKSLSKWLRTNKEALYKYSGIVIDFEKMRYPVRWFNSVLQNHFHLKTTSKQITVNGQKERVYQIDEAHLSKVRSITKLRRAAIIKRMSDDVVIPWNPDAITSTDRGTDQGIYLYKNNAQSVLSEIDSKPALLKGLRGSKPLDLDRVFLRPLNDQKIRWRPETRSKDGYSYRMIITVLPEIQRMYRDEKARSRRGTVIHIAPTPLVQAAQHLKSKKNDKFVCTDCGCTEKPRKIGSLRLCAGCSRPIEYETQPTQQVFTSAPQSNSVQVLDRGLIDERVEEELLMLMNLDSD